MAFFNLGRNQTSLQIKWKQFEATAHKEKLYQIDDKRNKKNTHTLPNAAGTFGSYQRAGDGVHQNTHTWVHAWTSYLQRDHLY